MSTFWPALGASLISAGSAILAVWIANRHQLKRHREQLREEALARQRELIADALLTGRDWADLQLLFVPILSKLSNQELMEFANSETATRLGATTKELRAALIRASLFIADETLRQIARGLSEFVEDFAEVINGPILSEPEESGHVFVGIREVSRFRTSLREFETCAIDRLPGPVWHLAGA